MGQPWGLSGPQFLGVYAAGIGLTIVIPFIIRQVIRGLPGHRTRRELDPYEVGYLVGGPRRAAEVVIAEGVDCGALRVDSSGRVTRAYQAAATGPHAGALDRVTLDGLSTHALATKLRSDPSIARIGPDVSADGLVISRGLMRVLRLVSAVLIVALLVAGILRLIEGSHNHRPIGDLTGLFVLSLITSFFVLMSWLARIRRRTWTAPGSASRRRRCCASAPAPWPARTQNSPRRSARSSARPSMATRPAGPAWRRAAPRLMPRNSPATCVEPGRTETVRFAVPRAAWQTQRGPGRCERDGAARQARTG